MYCFLVVYIQSVTPANFLLQFNLSSDYIYQNSNYIFYPDSSARAAISNRGIIKASTGNILFFPKQQVASYKLNFETASYWKKCELNYQTAT